MTFANACQQSINNVFVARGHRQYRDYRSRHCSCCRLSIFGPDGQKVDQRKLTVEGPVYGRTIKTVRVRIGTLSENADTMACSVVECKWVSWQQ
jgi:hypothetical protein